MDGQVKQAQDLCSLFMSVLKKNKSTSIYFYLLTQLSYDKYLCNRSLGSNRELLTQAVSVPEPNQVLFLTKPNQVVERLQWPFCLGH